MLAIRSLRRSPGFTAVAVLSLTLGIGATTAIFTLLNALAFRPLPVREPRQLTQFAYSSPTSAPNTYFDYPQFEQFRDDAQTLSGVFGGTALGRVNLVARGTAGLAQTHAYTASFFSVLGLAPQLGRFFTAAEDRSDSAVAVLSDRYWRTRFAGDPSIVGEPVTINQLPFTVIGVTPAGFAGVFAGNGPELWIPLHALDLLKPDPKRWTEPFTSWMAIMGRLNPGIDLTRAQAELDVIHRQALARQLTGSELRGSENMQRFVRESRLLLRPAATGGGSGLRDTYVFPLQLLLGVAGAVLLIVCANVASLQLARASDRRREIDIRLALGAGRWRIVRQLLAESLLVGAAGGALAVPLAWWGAAALVRAISTGDSPAPLDIAPDWRMFAFAAGVSLLAAMLFGLTPALRATRLEHGRFRRSSRALDRALVIAQVALSVVLIAGAGLFVRTLQKLWTVNVGYDRDNVMMFSVDARLAGYPIDRANDVYREVLRKLEGLPGVRSAAASVVRPVDDSFYLVDHVDAVDGRSLPERERIRVAWNGVTPGYFGTIATPLVLGRDFDLRDNETSPEVVIVNESLARRALPGQNPVGHRLEGATIVGVVKDALYGGPREQPRPVLYHPLFQHGPQQEYRWGFVSFELRSAAGAGLLEDARRAVASVDRNLPIFRGRTLRAQAEQALLRERLLAMLSSFFGGLALLLACLGLYGLMAYAVARRTGEIGIRMALGARHGHVLWMVLRETLWLAAAGAICGVPLALWTARFARTLLFGVAAGDTATLAITIGALLAAAALAGYLPARRAVRIDPMAALRNE